jgi:hypothetical protein
MELVRSATPFPARHPEVGGRSRAASFADRSIGSFRPSFCSPIIVRMMNQIATRMIVSMPMTTKNSMMLMNEPSRPIQNVRIAQV